MATIESRRILIANLVIAPIVVAILICTKTDGTRLRTILIEVGLLLAASCLLHGGFTKLPRAYGAWLVASVSLATISIPWYFLCLYAFQNHPGGMPTLLRFELLPLVIVPAALLESVDSYRLRARGFEEGSFKHRYLGWLSRL